MYKNEWILILQICPLSVFWDIKKSDLILNKHVFPFIFFFLWVYGSISVLAHQIYSKFQVTLNLRYILRQIYKHRTCDQLVLLFLLLSISNKNRRYKTNPVAHLFKMPENSHLHTSFLDIQLCTFPISTPSQRQGVCRRHIKKEGERQKRGTGAGNPIHLVFIWSSKISPYSTVIQLTCTCRRLCVHVCLHMYASTHA